MTSELRPYQQRAKDDVYALARAKEQSVVVVAPTGSGKTSLAASIILDLCNVGKRAAFIAHRIELLEQTRERLIGVGIPADKIGITAGKHEHTNPSAPVQVCSVSTLASRGDMPPASVVFVDEAHRACSPSYEAAINEYKEKGAFIIGLTATPKRSDGKPLRRVFENIVVVSTPAELVAEGFLAAPKMYGVPKSMAANMSGVKINGGDYNQEQASQRVNTKVIIGGITTHWKKYANDAQTIVFCCGVDHSKNIAAAFVAEGVKAEHVDGTFDKVARSGAMKRFRSGETKVLCNAELYIEGLDVPSAKCCVLARPTKSLTYYMQMVGRIMRPWNNVTPVVLDHAGCILEHGSVLDDREWSLDEVVQGGGTGRKVVPSEAKMCPRCFMYSPIEADECEECGYSFAVVNEIREEEGELEEIKPLDPELAMTFFKRLLSEAATNGQGHKWAFRQYMKLYGSRPPAIPMDIQSMAKEFSTLQRVAAIKGYKPGWAYHQFKVRFGCEPPRGVKL